MSQVGPCMVQVGLCMGQVGPCMPQVGSCMTQVDPSWAKFSPFEAKIGPWEVFGEADPACSWNFFTFPTAIRFDSLTFSDFKHPLNTLNTLKHLLKLCHKMLWVWSKFTFYMATKFFGKTYKSNSIAIKTLSTQLWNHWLAFSTKFSENFLCFSHLKFCYICIEICL